MFNNFNLSDEEIIKIINDYNPLIVRESILNAGIDEDLIQEIRMEIIRALKKNRKNKKIF